ncbi:MAG: hypothetical protein AB3N18_16995, partial [Allomuricauda sp.]
MMGKKSLEQLFKEVFKDYREVPDENVWKAIEASLDKKEKKRVIPIWWRLGGVAALLAILFYVVGPFDGSEKDDNIIITETQNDQKPIDGEGIGLEKEDSQQLVESSEDEIPDSDDNSTQGSESGVIENQGNESNQQLVSTTTGQETKNEASDIRRDKNEKQGVIKNQEYLIATNGANGQENTNAKTSEKNILNNKTEVAAVVGSDEDVSQNVRSNNRNQEQGIREDKKKF